MLGGDLRVNAANSDKCGDNQYYGWNGIKGLNVLNLEKFDEDEYGEIDLCAKGYYEIIDNFFNSCNDSEEELVNTKEGFIRRGCLNNKELDNAREQASNKVAREREEIKNNQQIDLRGGVCPAKHRR